MEKAFHRSMEELFPAERTACRGWALAQDYALSREWTAMTHAWRVPGSREHIVATKGAPESVARLCGMSERNLLRLFKQTTGESVAAFVRNIRCDRAREMLAQTELPLKEIAYRLGFASHSSFTAAFRRETGINPTDFRRDHAIRRARAH